ncbi:hypothetical protein RJ55_03193 [Drechmeria coniospora]|nr:hypothetical protein RJ55_03193 [Drechmeria coniospora]
MHGRQSRAAGSCRPLLCNFFLASPVTICLLPASVRLASLSAIHRGLRKSSQVRFDEESSRTRDGGRGRGRTSRALDGAANYRQQQKLRKKLDRKASADDEDEIGRQTRRKRFLDPEFSFGKKSLVYQLKHGNLKGKATSLNLPEPVRPAPSPAAGDAPRPSVSFSSRMSERAFAAKFQSARSPNDGDGGQPRTRWRTRAQASDRLAARPSWSRSTRTNASSSRSGWRHKEEDAKGSKEAYDSTSGMSDTGGHEAVAPVNVKYTTAASQFLYGRSVVRAALEQARRKLYKLYLYGGDNRKESKETAMLTRLAERRAVPIQVVPREHQRLMDKMSMGRPHNGFVLETSPLPQLPVKALGKLEESPTRLGFHVQLDHQTKEEEAVNGTGTFIRRSTDVTPKPFVLLLNEILDPGNLGALLRTASYLGVDAVGITNRGSSALTAVVLKSAAGAAEEMTIFTVDSPVEFIDESRKAGWKTYAAVAPPERKLVKLHGRKFLSTDAIEQDGPLAHDPCILVLGNEGYGLSKAIKVAADHELSVPRFVEDSSVDSLNSLSSVRLGKVSMRVRLCFKQALHS